MKKQFKPALLLLFIALILPMLLTNVQAAGSTSDQLKRQLEQDYGFLITVPAKEFSSATEEDKLFFYRELECALKALNKDFVKEVTGFFKSRKMTPKIVIDMASWGFVEGSFGYTSKDATITLYHSPPEKKNFLRNFTIAHEFGHMVNVALDYKVGSQKIKNAWSAINDSEADPKKAYVSDYARESYREDFAEMFAHLAAPEEDIFAGLMLENPDSVVLKKMQYLDELLRNNFSSYKGPETFGYILPQRPSVWAKDTVETLFKEVIISDYYHYRYQANITRAEFCELLFHIVFGYKYDHDEVTTCTFYKKPFHDVSPYNWELRGIQDYAINKAYDLGIVSGSTDGYYFPLNYITRQEAALMLKNAIEYLENQEFKSQGIELPFSDKDSISAWAKEAVEFVYLRGIMRGGSNNKFEPLGHFTYEQAYMTFDAIRRQYKQ